MKVFVIGGTGAVGRHAVRALASAGHDVTGVAHSDEKAEQLRRDGGGPVEVSIFDADALVDAFAGCDAVASLATAIPSMTRFVSAKAWSAKDRVGIEGSTAIVDAAGRAGVGRLLQESVVMPYRDGGDTWIDEADPVDDFPLARANLAAEANTRRFSDEGGTGVVLRFGWFYGPGATHSEQFFALARRHICVQMGRADTYVSSIHVADAGAAVEEVLRVPAGTYNVVDDEPLTKRSYAEALATAAGVRPWVRYPGRSALALGDRTTSLTRSVRASNRRFRDVADWVPSFRSAHEGWLATSADLAAR